MWNARKLGLLMGGVMMLSLATPAAAVQMIATYKGTITSSNDGLGLFGNAESLIGYDYTTTYFYNTDDLSYFPRSPDGDRVDASGPAAWSFELNGLTLLNDARLLNHLVDGPLSTDERNKNNSDTVLHTVQQTTILGRQAYAINAVETSLRSITNGLDMGQIINYVLQIGDGGQGQFIVGDDRGNNGTQLVMNVTSVDIRPVAIAAVPEPTSWTMMLTGFGAVAGALRARRRRVAFAQG